MKTAEVLLLENEIFIFRSGNECKFFVSGPIEEVGGFLDFFYRYIVVRKNFFHQNELILVGVLDVMYDTVSTLLKGQARNPYILAHYIPSFCDPYRSGILTETVVHLAHYIPFCD